MPFATSLLHRLNGTPKFARRQNSLGATGHQKGHYSREIRPITAGGGGGGIRTLGTAVARATVFKTPASSNVRTRSACSLRSLSHFNPIAARGTLRARRRRVGMRVSSPTACAHARQGGPLHVVYRSVSVEQVRRGHGKPSHRAAGRSPVGGPLLTSTNGSARTAASARARAKFLAVCAFVSLWSYRRLSGPISLDPSRSGSKHRYLARSRYAR